MDQVFIKDLVVKGIIGINDWERENLQEILINITLFADLSAAGISDSIDDCVNYRTVTKEIIRLVDSVQRFTVEALAADIAHSCLKHAKVQKVRVRVEKPGAVRFSKSVGVEIERSKGEYPTGP